ncbi:glycerol kinase [Legionella beliardensis]|uniref:glycerol kinase n=1 Tax=Legionella beliardensis TaxID=91822 RepID=A0A378I0U2_9GAMM|nr:glycerol kinase GlpK [Legionella beliardensis]STX28769.1 glycerol kinase [Legionella beliardensis]
MQKYLLAIDQGTSSTRAIIYTHLGQEIAISQYDLTQFYPHAGWVEHCPEEIWSKTLKAINDVIAQIDVKKLVACGITNQRETTLIWDKETGKCLYPAIVWQDRRTEEFCSSLDKEMIKKKTGLLPDSYFSASKLHWLLQHCPEAKTLAAQNQLAFGTIDSFLIWRFTQGKVHATDVTNASRTLLFNIFKQEWDKELLTLFGVNPSVLPEVKACDAYFGEIDQGLFGFSIPITGVAGDQQAALIGQRGLDEGMIKATYGTGAFLLMNTGSRPISSNNLLTTVAYKIKDNLAYGLEGSIYQAGTTIKWLRDEMKLLASAAESEELAASLADNEGVYLIPAFNGLGAPYWLASSGALIVGLTRKSNRAHFARAALESVCYQTKQILQCMQQESNIIIKILRVDGGMTVNQWLLQFLASQCQVTVQRPKNIETTAQGAALLAAIGCGELSSINALKASWQCEQEFLPENKQIQIESNFAGWLHAINMLIANSG